MKNNITLSDIQGIPVGTLAELVYAQMDSYPILYEKVEKILLKSDPKALVKSIKKDIASIRRGRKFISYYDAFDYAEKIANIIDDIAMMVDDTKVASGLYRELILTDSKVYLRSDDSAGALQMSYAKAVDGWTECLEVLSDDEIHDDIMEMLICEGFGVRSIFSERVPSAVLQKIYEVFYVKCQTGDCDGYDDKYILKTTSHYLKKPELYIQALTLESGKPEERDWLDIAGEYRYADDAQSAVAALDKITSVDAYVARDFYELKVWANEALGRPIEVTLAYKHWYTLTKSPEILKIYLGRLEGELRKKVKDEALEDARELSFAQALYFFHSLDETALASAYIREHQKSMETEYIYAKELKKIANWLKHDFPQEAILLYRDSCEKSLAASQSKHYPSAIKDLKESLKIEEEQAVSSWFIEENGAYMERLLVLHKRKPKFVELFLKAFG